MRARVVLLLVALAGPAAAAERADGPGDTGLLLGARGGYAVASGRFEAGGVEVRDVVRHAVPLWLELGYRFDRHWRGELFFALAPASVADAYCTPETSCSASDARFGVAVQLHLAPSRLLDPWLGVGVAIEVLNAQLTDAEPLAPPGRQDLTFAGFELPLVEGGVDVTVSRRFSVGPYVSASFGQFTSAARRPRGGARTSAAVDERAGHRWLQAGLKTTLRL